VSAQETLKLSVANNVVLVPLRVNGRSLLFLFDTGSERSAIDARLAELLGLKGIGDLQILRNYRVQETSAAAAGTLAIGKHVFEHTLLTVVNMERLPGRSELMWTGSWVMTFSENLALD
jgi:hypothetical protein